MTAAHGQSPEKRDRSTEPEQETPRAAIPSDRSRRGGRSIPRAGVVIAIGASLLLVVGLALRGGDAVDARATVNGNTDSAVVGEATIAGKTVSISLEAVPTPPDGYHYEVWLLPEGSDATISIGRLDGGGAADLDLPLPPGGPFGAIDISVEEDGGPATHSGRSLASGSFA